LRIFVVEIDDKDTGMTTIELDMIQTAAIGALALIVGMVLTRKVAFLQKFCVPSPVSGGIIFSLLTLVLYGRYRE